MLQTYLLRREMILNSNRKNRSLKSNISKEKFQKEVEKSKCSGSTVV